MSASTSSRTPRADRIRQAWPLLYILVPDSPAEFVTINQPGCSSTLAKISVVLKSFGADAAGARRFVARWLPDDWKPRIVMPGYWDAEDERDSSPGHITRIVRLENAPAGSLFTKIDTRYDGSVERGRATYKRTRDSLLAWLYRLEDDGKITLRNSGSMGADFGTWTSRYTVGRIRGSFAATIIPQGRKSATLALHLSES